MPSSDQKFIYAGKGAFPKSIDGRLNSKGFEIAWHGLLGRQVSLHRNSEGKSMNTTPLFATKPSSPSDFSNYIPSIYSQ